jgi:spoIIIJ-associated protein
MDEKRTSLEMIAPSVEEAVERGLADLGVTEIEVEIEVLDEGNRGLFGIGARQARVRLTLKSFEKDENQTVGQGLDTPAIAEFVTESEDDLQSATLEEKPFEDDKIEEAENEIRKPNEQDDLVLNVARETVKELLEAMHVIADVTARYLEPDDSHSRPALLVDVQGEDLSFLISPRGETINALQYIAHLIVGKELGRSVPMIVDIMGYRERRAGQVKRLARQMAEQAIRSGRRQSLEPMPANERRLVHIELRNNPKVTTESIGDEPRRKVTIIPR